MQLEPHVSSVQVRSAWYAVSTAQSGGLGSATQDQQVASFPQASAVAQHDPLPRQLAHAQLGYERLLSHTG
jgi:hypothetical protein